MTKKCRIYRLGYKAEPHLLCWQVNYAGQPWSAILAEFLDSSKAAKLVKITKKNQQKPIKKC